MIPFFICIFNFFEPFLTINDDSKSIRKLSWVFNAQIKRELDRIDSFGDYEELKKVM